MLTLAQQEELLAAFPALHTMFATEREPIGRQARLVEAEAQTLLFDETSPCGSFPLLLEGTVRVTRQGEEGREILLYRVHPGEMCLLSINCLLGDMGYPARRVTESVVRAIKFPPDLFLHLVTNHVPFRNYVFRLFAERMQELMALVDAVAFQQLDRRLASLLLARGAAIRSTHQQLADELGTVRVMVSRLLERFEHAGFVRLSREHIQLLDTVAPHRIAGTPV